MIMLWFILGMCICPAQKANGHCYIHVDDPLAWDGSQGANQTACAMSLVDLLSGWFISAEIAPTLITRT